MQKFDDRLSAVTTIQHQISSAMEDAIRLSGNKRQLNERFGGVASPIQPLESHEVALFSPQSVSPIDSEIKTRRPVLAKVNDNTGTPSKIIESGTKDKYTIQGIAKLCRVAQTLRIKFQYLHWISTLTILRCWPKRWTHHVFCH